jgi:hypothetical protein
MLAYHATIDFYKKTMTIHPPDGPAIMFCGGKLFADVPIWGGEAVGLVF